MNRYILEILHVLFKHKRIVLATFLVIFGAVAAGLAFRPSVYRAPGRIMITGQRAYFRLSTAEGRQGGSATDILRDINTEIENIKSTDFLAKIVKGLPFSLIGPTADDTTQGEEPGILSRSITTLKYAVSMLVSIPNRVSKTLRAMLSPLPSDSPQVAQGSLSPEVRQGIAVLRAALEVTAVPNSMLVEIAYTDPDPKRAAVIVNSILENYPHHQASLHQDPIALAFYDKQKQQLSQAILELQEKMKKFEERENAVSLTNQKEQVLDLLEKTKDRLKSTDVDIDQAIGKIAKIEQELPKQAATVIQAQELANPESKLLQERFTTLEIEKNELLQKYTEKDRRVQDKNAEILATQEKLTASTGKNKVVIGERIGLNPVREDMLKELADQKIKLGQLYPKQDILRRQVDELHSELETLNAKSYEHERMEEELKDMKDHFELYSKKAEEARISGAMDQEDLVNVKITDRAQVPSAPLPSNAAILLALAAIIGFGGGVGGVLALEYVRPTFHSELDVERHLQLPVLALIPDLREEA